MALEAEAVLVELDAVVGGDDHHRAIEELAALQVVEHLSQQGVDVVHSLEVPHVARPQLRRGAGGRWNRRVIVGGRLDGDRGVVVEEAEKRTRRVPPAEPFEPLAGQHAISPAGVVARGGLQTQIGHVGEGRAIEVDQAVDRRAGE